MLRSWKPANCVLLGTLLGALPLAGAALADGRAYIQQASPALGVAYVRQVDRQAPVRLVRAVPPAPAAPTRAAPTPSRTAPPPQAAEEVVMLELAMPETETGQFPDAHLDVP